jgi:hypothetical protein
MGRRARSIISTTHPVMATQKIASRRRRLLSAPAYPAMRDEQIRVPKEARRVRRVCKFGFRCAVSSQRLTLPEFEAVHPRAVARLHSAVTQ